MADIKFIPGVHPTYKEQFDKLTRAYIANEVEMYDNCKCFVGNLLNGSHMWSKARDVVWSPSNYYPTESCLSSGKEFSQGLNAINKASSGFYTIHEIIKLEGVFMQFGRSEEGLFQGFVLALDLLRQIHESKGEIIDEVPAFTKRELKTA